MFGMPCVERTPFVVLYYFQSGTVDIVHIVCALCVWGHFSCSLSVFFLCPFVCVYCYFFHCVILHVYGLCNLTFLFFLCACTVFILCTSCCA